MACMMLIKSTYKVNMCYHMATCAMMKDKTSM